MSHQANIYKQLQRMYHKLYEEKRKYNNGDISRSDMKDFYKSVRDNIEHIEREYSLTPNTWLQLVLLKRVINVVDFLNTETDAENILDMDVEL
jgi:hypothetical protein